MKACKVLSATFILFITITQQSFGAIGFNDAIFPELITVGRALSLGSAYNAHANDASSVYYNPAGLGSVRNTHLHLSNIQLESNKGWANTYMKGSVTDILSNAASSLSLEKMRENLLTKRGEISHFKAQAMPNFTTRFLSLGLMASKQIRATIGKLDAATFEYAKRTDYGPYAALALATFGGIFKIGVTATLLTRSEATGEQVRTVAVDLKDTDYKKGTALIVTTGAKLTFPVAALPTFSATMHNSAGTAFSAASGSGGAPDEIRKSIDVGFSLSPKMGNQIFFHMEYNYKDINNQFTSISAQRKSLFGVEMDFARAFFLRFGYGDGYGCFGVGFKHQRMAFDLSTYAIDTTTTEYRGEEDRRFIFSLSAGI